MADRIRGITIEIDGDTKGLSQALKGVNKDIKTTQTQLKDVNKLLKLDPSNATLLRQKMELLNREITQTKDKLSQLKSVQEEMKRGLKNGTVTQDQYDAWQREIIETENELKSLEAEIKKVPTASEAAIAKVSDDMDKLGQKVSAVGDKMASVGDTMSRTVTAGIVAAGTASIAAWQEVDSAMDDLIKKTGATGESLEHMETIVNSIATSIPSDFSTIANAVGEVNTRFDVTGNDLENLSTAFIKFADLNNTDVVSSIDSVSSMMKAWGLDAKDTAGVLDLLNGVGQQTGVSVNTLADIMQSNALTFKELNLTTAQAATLLGRMEKNGIDASAGVSALRKAMSYATDNGMTLNEVMAEWQELMNSTASDAEKMAATEDLFGSRSYTQLFNALREGNISFTEIDASMADFRGNVEKTFEATLDPIDDFTTTMNELKILGAEIGEEVLPVLVDVLKDLKPILDDIKSAWESMSEEEQRQLIENLGKLALIGPALSVTGRTITAVGTAISALGKAGKTLSSLGIGAKIGSIFGGGGTAASTAGASLGTSLITGLAAGLAAATAGGAIGKALDNYVIAPILEYFNSDSAQWYKDFHWFGEGGFFDYMFGGGDIHAAVADYYGAFREMGADIAQSFEDMKTNASKKWDEFKSNISTKSDELEEGISSTWEDIKSRTSERWGEVKSTISDAWTSIKDTFTEFKDGVFQTFQDIFDKIKGIWDSLGELFMKGFDIKLPHISVSGGEAPYGIGGMGSLPKFSVDWYANGGILTNPTIFGSQGGRLLGGGEAGAEAVLPLSKLDEMITSGMVAAMGGTGDTIINVSIDNNSLGSVILTAQQMMNLRRGK